MAEPVTIQDIYNLFRASQQESERRAAAADYRTAELDRQLATLAAEADRRLTRIERLAAQASQEVSRLGSRWGQFVENLVEPAVVQLFHARGIEVLRALGGVRKSTAQLFDMEQPQNGIPRRDKRDTKGARPWVADRAGLT
jgi:hypothetical protein